MRFRVALAAVVVTLGGCNGPTTEAMGAVSALMKDPGSTQFRRVEEVDQGDGTKAVCGEFNSKNSFGAYVGYKGFVVYEGQVFLESDVGDPTRSAAEIGNSIAYIDASRVRCIEPVTRQLRAKN